MAYTSNKKIEDLDALTSLDDTDVLPSGDTSDSGRAKKITWANLKTAIQTYITGLASYFNKSTETLDDINAGTTNVHFTATDESKLDGIEAGAEVTDATNIASSITGVSVKATPIDADEIALIDTESANALKKATFTNLKAFLKTYNDTLYQSAGSYIGAVVDDTSPKLGGDLDVNGNKITSSSNGNIELTPNGTGRIGLYTSNPENYFSDGGLVLLQDDGNYSDFGNILVADSGYPMFALSRSRGTIGSEAIVQVGDYLGAMDFRGYDGDDFETSGGKIYAKVIGTPASNSISADIHINPTVGDVFIDSDLRIEDDNAIKLGDSSDAEIYYDSDNALVIKGINGAITLENPTDEDIECNESFNLASGKTYKINDTQIALANLSDGGDVLLKAGGTMTGDILGAVSLGETGTRLTKGWFTDLEVTNAIAGSVTGNAGTVTNGVYTGDAGTVFLAPDGDGASLSNVLHDLVDDTTPQLGGDLDAQDKNITGAGRVSFTQELDNGSKTANFSVDFATDQKQKCTLTANTITLTLDTTSVGVGNYLLKIVNGGLATLTWASESGAIYWPGGTEPTLTSSGTDIVSFYFDGTNWYAQASLDFS